MNKAETIVYNQLIKGGYKPNEIKHSPRISPDFILSDGIEVEVKSVTNFGYITFTKVQVKKLKDNCKIWIVNNGKIIKKTTFIKIKINKLPIYNKHNLDVYLKFRVIKKKVVTDKKLTSIKIEKNISKKLNVLKEEMCAKNKSETIRFLLSFFYTNGKEVKK